MIRDVFVSERMTLVHRVVLGDEEVNSMVTMWAETSTTNVLVDGQVGCMRLSAG